MVVKCSGKHTNEIVYITDFSAVSAIINISLNRHGNFSFVITAVMLKFPTDALYDTV